MAKLNDIKEVEETQVFDNGLDFLQKRESKYSNYYFCKLRTKKEIIPHFDISKDINGIIQKITTKDPIQRIYGKLLNIEFKEGTYQNQVIKSVVFKIETLNSDGNLVCFRISCSRNQSLQNWLNCLLSQNEKIDTLELSVWKDKNSGYNKSTMKVNGKRPSWRYTIDEIEEKKEKIYDKKGNLIATKTDDLFDFLENELKEKLDVLIPNRIKDEDSTTIDNFFQPTDGPIDREGEEEQDFLKGMFEDE